MVACRQWYNECTPISNWQVVLEQCISGYILDTHLEGTNLISSDPTTQWGYQRIRTTHQRWLYHFFASVRLYNFLLFKARKRPEKVEREEEGGGGEGWNGKTMEGSEWKPHELLAFISTL